MDHTVDEMGHTPKENGHDRSVPTEDLSTPHRYQSSSTTSHTARRMPNHILRHEGSSSSLTIPSANPATTEQIITVARELMNSAIEENRSKAAETSQVSNSLKPGVTLDFSHKGIQKEFPEEVIDIIKVELERLALSHNLISTFPLKFAECTSLRYLNVRNNMIREFPTVICGLRSLEILDLGRNKLRILPPDIVGLVSLKVLSVQKNRIEDLPLCIAEMASLQVLKLEGNPIRFPPKDVLIPGPMSPPNGIPGGKEKETSEVLVTIQIKKYLRQQKASQERSETESGEEESSEGAETPRPVRRVMSGRFPIKVNGTELYDLRSPALPRAPPIPSRSHQRGMSQQTASGRRPSIMPLSMGNVNERMRSNSEGLLQARERNESRLRRMGVVSKKPEARGSLNGINLNRYSHLRGLSHGSAFNDGVDTSKSPASPGDILTVKSGYNRRLSSLPEKKRKSTFQDPVMEGARGILYALAQVHPLISNLVGLSRDDGSNKRTSLERVFYNATTQVERLHRDIASYDNYSEEDEETAPRTNEIVHSACLTCVAAYNHVCGLLNRNVETLVQNSDPRYIRSLLVNVYSSLAEVRNASLSLRATGSRPANVRATTARPPVVTISDVASDQTLRPVRGSSQAATRERPGTPNRFRSATVVHHSQGLRVATDPSRIPKTRLGGRSATMTSSTPRSGESFHSNGSRILHSDFSEDDRLFEKIYLGFQYAAELTIKTLPGVEMNFEGLQRRSKQQRHDQLVEQWQILRNHCKTALGNAEMLKGRLSLIKLKEPGIRTERAFWDLCEAFIQSYYNLISKIKEVKPMTPLLSSEIIAALRPLHGPITDTGRLWSSSPWSSLLNNHAPQTATHAQSPSTQVQLPMTLASVALGPAVQATVPSTPHSASYNAMFTGNVFERADALLSNTSHSRSGTMTSSFGGGATNGDLNNGQHTNSPATSMNSRFVSNIQNKVSF